MHGRPLALSETVEVSRVRQRLLLGVQWLDAVTRRPVSVPLTSILESIGERPFSQAFDLHSQSRHALCFGGPLAKLLARAAQEKIDSPPPSPAEDPTNFTLRSFAGRQSLTGSYGSDESSRQYVPRRLALTPVQTDGVPSDTTANIREAWLWPGATYPLSANATGIRGCIRRGATLNAATPVAWARVIITRPANLGVPPDFSIEPRVGWAHGDDRGEFLVVLGAEASPGGAALAATLPLRLWAFLPPAALVDAADPLASLVLEQARSDAASDVLRGLVPPPTHVRQAPVNIPLATGEALRPGAVLVMPDAALLFA